MTSYRHFENDDHGGSEVPVREKARSVAVDTKGRRRGREKVTSLRVCGTERTVKGQD